MRTKVKPSIRIKMMVKQLKHDNTAFAKKVTDFKAACDAYQKNHASDDCQKKETLL
jgi:hypothetical protein